MGSARATENGRSADFFSRRSAVARLLVSTSFQIIYPPAVALLPPPGRVSLIAPATDEGRLVLRWIEAEDPALASTTEPPAQGKVAHDAGTIQHAPSYLSHQPALKEVPAYAPQIRGNPQRPTAGTSSIERRTVKASRMLPINVATTVRFSVELDALGPAQYPKMKFTASGHESPQAAQFRVAVNENGAVRYCFLENSSGDAALDEQARKYLALCRFPSSARHPSAKAARRSCLGPRNRRMGQRHRALVPAQPEARHAVIRVSLSALVTIYLLVFLAAVFLLWIVG